MLLQTLTTKGRRALLASTVAFSWFVANPMLPADFSGDASTLGAALAKGNHGGKHNGKADNGHHGKHHGQRGKNSPNSTGDDDDSDDDDDSGDDDNGDDDDGADDDSSPDDNSPDDDASDDDSVSNPAG